MKYFITLCVSFFLLQSSFAQKHWESIILAENTWSYLPAISEPASDWNQPGFADDSWATGPGGFGFADDDDATIIDSVNSIYLRKTFNIADTSIIEQLILDVDYDDAFIAYLNGNEIARSSNITDNPPLYNSTLTVDHEALLYQGMTPERHILDPKILLQGDNVIAVQIINNNINSSDMSGLIFLNAEINCPSIVYQSTPGWFFAPITNGESNLPIILINTNGQTIMDEPRITAQMSVVNNTSGINNINDTIFEYNGDIDIEIRGSSSQSFDKKNYNVETIFDADSNLNVSLLGMPGENDWVLHGPYSDKSLMRNVLTYHLGNLTGRWSPRTKFCELYINDDYRGVYVLIEKIKRDNNRVDIAKLNPDEISGDDLTGGYILKIDRPDNGFWTSPYKGRDGYNDIHISYVEPEYADMPDEQHSYIKNYVTGFESALNGADFKDPYTGYRSYIDLYSFIDYYIINELSRNVDGYRLSAFFYKDKNSNGGKLTMGPLWDYNLGFGNADYYDGGNTRGWMADGFGSGDSYQIPFWWDRLREDPYFDAHLKIRWETLRNDKFSNANINAFIDSCAALLESAQQRNFQKFNVLNSYVWPNNYVGGSFASEINYLKEWTADRLSWMDTKIGAINSIDNTFAGSLEIKTFPNPFTSYVSINWKVDYASNASISIRNILGEKIYEKTLQCSTGENTIVIEAPVFGQGNGVYFYELKINNKLSATGKLIRK